MTPNALHRVHVKICCISSVEEAELAISAGATYLGLVSAMPSGPGVISDAAITRIRHQIGDRAKTVLLTSRTTAAGIGEQLTLHHPSVIQLTDSVDRSELETLRGAYPSVALMQVIHVQSQASVAEAAAIAPHVDFLLLDSGNPSAAIKELGGTGRVHDWTLSRQIRDSVDVPLFLAGGLHADNVNDAIRAVRPWGVDVCSGVRVNGALSPERTASFVSRIRDFDSTDSER